MTDSLARSIPDDQEPVEQLVDSPAMQRLASATVETLENERRRLAHELHDGPVQRLAAVQLNLERVRMSLPEAGSASEAIGQAIVKLGGEVQNLRRKMAALRPPPLDDGGLVSAIERYVTERSAGSPIAWHVDLTLDRTLSVTSGTILYRVMQEAVANAVRHARARSISVRLGFEGGAVRLRVIDDGIGFDPQAAGSDGDCLGLTGMRRMLAIVRGELRITSGRGGTEVCATILEPRSSALGVGS